MAKRKLVATKTGATGNVPGYGSTTSPSVATPGFGNVPGYGAIGANGLQDGVAGNSFSGASPGYTDPYSAARSQFDTLLGNATNSAGTGYKNALADSIAGEGATALDLGATLGARDPGLDPTAATQGSFDWNNVEASNPFSKAALLVRNYHQQQNRSTNSLAAMGQSGGALNNARAEDTFGFQSGQDQLSKALQGYLAEQARSRRNAAVTRDDTINSAGLQGLQSLLGG